MLKPLRKSELLNSKEPRAFLKTLIALLIVFLCLIAAKWQYQRGMDRKAVNSKIEANALMSAVPLQNLENIGNSEWREVTVTGEFDLNHEVLLRNRYNYEGKYGFEYLTLFKTNTGDQFWVDRGWVQAGPTALSRPEIPKTPSGEIEISGRIRLENSLPKGSFFALPSAGNLINDWDLKSKVDTENFYIDLINGSGVKPDSPAELPELSDGPHLAYALQWLFFAGLAIYGRYLIRKR
jgi:cytochrome oxidase assembly protein ShyY1